MPSRKLDATINSLSFPFSIASFSTYHRALCFTNPKAEAKFSMVRIDRDRTHVVGTAEYPDLQ
jgi:hypothetical protein